MVDNSDSDDPPVEQRVVRANITNSLAVLHQNTMRIGFNYPHSYNRFGSDFGPNIWVSDLDWDKYNALEASGNLASIPLPPLFDHVDRNLANLQKMGFSVIRWFVLGNGNAYGLAPTRVLRWVSKFFNYYDYTFTPPLTVDKRFRRDFEELLKHFKIMQLQLIPSLISFEFGSRDKAGTGPAPGTGYGGRADVIRDPAKRKVFLDTMLAELLATSIPFKEQIFAWEVINEPVWLCQDIGPLSTPNWASRIPEISWSEMTDFLNDALKRIKDAGFESTVGHRFFDDLKRFPTGSIPQFHYYCEHRWYAVGSYKSDPENIKGANLFGGNSKPILGEFDSAENRFGESWKKDLGSTDSTAERLRLLEREGCDLALIWPDLGGAKEGRVSPTTLQPEIDAVNKNDVIKLLGTTRQEIVNHTGGTMPPVNE